MSSYVDADEIDACAGDRDADVDESEVGSDVVASSGRGEEDATISDPTVSLLSKFKSCSLHKASC